MDELTNEVNFYINQKISIKKTRKLLILLVLLCCVISVHAQVSINYKHVKTVFADGRVITPSEYMNTNTSFLFEGDYVYMGGQKSIMGDGTDGYRLHSTQNGKSIYYYYRSGTAGLVQRYRTSQPYWDYRTAIIVSYDRKTINMCNYDNSGNLKSTSVYKVPSAPSASDFIE